MNRISSLMLCLLCIALKNSPSFSQGYIKPSSLSEYVNPTASISSPPAYTIAHVSNYHAQGVLFVPAEMPGAVETLSDLYTWAGGSINVVLTDSGFYGCGVGWQRRTPGGVSAGALLNAGYISLGTFCYDPEVAFIKHGNIYYVFVAYYVSGDYFGLSDNGFYYDIYKWGSGGLIPYSTHNLLESTDQYGRISIDAHNMYALSIVWRGETGIRTKLFSSWESSSGLEVALFPKTTPIFTVEGTSSISFAPDVAIAHAGSGDSGLYVRILYQDSFSSSTSWHRVKHRNFWSLFAPILPDTAAFTLDDSLLADGRSGHGLDGLRTQLDCPDHSPKDQWAYSYINAGDVQMRYLKPGATVAATKNITAGYFADALGDKWFSSTSLAYHNTGSHKIEIGWHDNYERKFVAVTYSDSGTRVGHVDTFMRVANTPYYMQSTNSMSFSKQNDFTAQLYTSFNASMSSTVPDRGMIRHKFVSYSHTAYRPGGPADSTTKVASPATGAAFTVLAYPNPFSDRSQLIINGDDGQKKYEMILYSATGQALGQASGNLQQLNKALASIISKASSGNYYISIKYQAYNYTLKIVKK